MHEKVSGQYKERISLQAECELFMRSVFSRPSYLADQGSSRMMSAIVNISCGVSSVASSAILLLLRELEAACEPALQTLARMNWGAQNEHVTGQSAFVDELVRGLEAVAEAVRPLVEGKKYVRNFFDKAARCVESFRCWPHPREMETAMLTRPIVADKYSYLQLGHREIYQCACEESTAERERGRAGSWILSWSV